MKKSKIGMGGWLLRGLGVITLALSLVFTLSIASSAEEVETGEIDQTVGESSFYDSAVGFLGEHLPLLLSGMTLVGTALLARIFRSSLLPILESGMKRVGGGVESLEEQTKAWLKASENELSELSALVSRLAETSGAQDERTAELKAELLGSLRGLADSVSLEAARLDSVLQMLKEVFTAARLPAASKLALLQIYEKTPHENAGVGKCSLDLEGLK